MKKWIFSILAFSLTFPVMLFFGFFLVILLAGPHSDILPGFLHLPVVLLILLIVLTVPAWLAYKIFRRFNNDVFE
jgi:membrane protein DedA with SNARE-associated domain